MNNQPNSDIQQTPEADFEIARSAFNSGHLPHAIFHLGCALSANPNNREWLAFLDNILAATPKPLELIPSEERTYFATAAIKAYILAKLGEYNQAIALLCQVMRAISNLSYLPWIADWLSNPSVVALIETDIAIAALSTIAAHFSDRIDDEIAASHIEGLLPAMEQLRQAYPEEQFLQFFYISVLRKLGKLDRAFELAESNYKASPNWHAAVGLALVHREKGELPEAIASYQNAIKHDPQELSVYLDIADLLCQTGDLETGISYYQQVLDRQPNHPWALPHYYFYRFFIDYDDAWNQKLQEYAAVNPDNQPAANLAMGLQETLTPYFGYLPEPAEASINILKQLEESEASMKGELTITLSVLEAPSARLAVDIYVREKWAFDRAIFNIEQIQTPDPRLPIESVEYQLWRYEGTEPIPAVREPSTTVAEAIAFLAARPYRLSEWATVARQLAADLGADSLDDILGVMLHPPAYPRRDSSATNAPETKMAIWIWIHRLQVAAALTIAYLDAGWEGSLRKRVLLSLACGPMDWSVEAAIIALTQIALEEEDAATEIEGLFMKMLELVPAPGHCPYLYGLICCSLGLPSLGSQTRSDLENYKRELEDWLRSPDS